MNGYLRRQPCEQKLLIISFFRNHNPLGLQIHLININLKNYLNNEKTKTINYEKNLPYICRFKSVNSGLRNRYNPNKRTADTSQ